MSDAKSPPELSMDEILATIRRIIAEDEQPGGLAAGGATGGSAGTASSAGTGSDTAAGSGGAAAKDIALETADEIVELTEAINEDGTVRHLVPIGGTSRIAALREPAPTAAQVEPEPEPAAPTADAPSPPAMPLQAVHPAPGLAPSPAVAPGPAVAPEPAAAPEPAVAIDERLESDWASTAAGAAFARLASAPRESHPEREIALGAADRTLEGVVSDLLRPVLRTWLDEHLPEIVERLVKAEIARVGKPGPS
jgi:cell pole-organizing protein PopZ